MKKFLFLLFFIYSLFSIHYSLFSQFFSFTYKSKTVTYDTINISLAPSCDTSISVVVYNNTSFSINVKLKKIIKNNVAGSQNTFCWDECYGPDTYISSGYVPISAGGNSTQFSADYSPLGNIGTTTILYVFFDMNNTKDSSYFYVNYITKPTSVPNYQLSIINCQLSIYPNPSSLQTTISYELTENTNVSLKIYDMLGNQVSCLINQNMTKGTYKLNYNAENLPAGFYYCALICHNQILSIKKFSVIH